MLRPDVIVRCADRDRSAWIEANLEGEEEGGSDFIRKHHRSSATGENGIVLRGLQLMRIIRRTHPLGG